MDMKAALKKQADLLPGTELAEQQKRVIERLKTEPGLLAYHGLGSGKTLASIASAENLGGNTNVIVPAALRENYRKELGKFVAGKAENYNVTSYDQAAKLPLPPATLNVFDEAHRMGRDESAISRIPSKVQGKTLLLSGSPVRNKPNELVPLLRAIASDRPIPRSAQAFDQQFIGQQAIPRTFWQWIKGDEPKMETVLTNRDQLKQLLAGRVDYHPSRGEFPTKQTQTFEIPMTKPQDEMYRTFMSSNPILYYKIRRNLPPSKTESRQLNAFLSAVRKSVV